MDSPEEIERLAQERLEEAKVLYANGKCDGAFYLAGYSVELTLKARICRTFGIHGLFKDGFNEKLGGFELADLKKLLKTHNIFLLLVLAGLKVKFDNAKAQKLELMKFSSLFFSNWSEQSRYKPCGTMKPADVKALIDLLDGKDGVLQWIRTS